MLMSLKQANKAETSFNPLEKSKNGLPKKPAQTLKTTRSDAQKA